MATARSHAAPTIERALDRSASGDAVVAILPLPSAPQVLAALAAVAVALCGLSLLDIALGQTSPALRVVDTAFEANVPTWLSSAMWLAAALLAYATGAAARRLDDPAGGRWALLGSGFLLLAIDETAQLHEPVVGPAIDAVETVTGLAHGPARLVAAACAGVALLPLLAWLWPWMRALPSALRSRLLLAGAVFVGSALGLEVLSRLVDTPYLSPFEELGEMLGVALLVSTLVPCVRAVIARTP